MSDENNIVTDPEIDTPSDPQSQPEPQPEPEPTPFDPDCILHTTKVAVGLPLDYTPFDAQVVMEINTVLSIVNQLGIGVNGYEVGINDGTYTGTWSEFLADEIDDNIFMNEVKTYVAKRVQILFDPPTSGILMDAMNRNIEELEWRIVVHKETP